MCLIYTLFCQQYFLQNMICYCQNQILKDAFLLLEDTEQILAPSAINAEIDVDKRLLFYQHLHY